ncbi:MAG: hypothetical protein P8N98_21895, partial [Paracoccaceae bacterium]|nr:hypothetical protein [Paracoccaceae bacterium]
IRHAIVLADDPIDTEQWKEANQHWLTDSSLIFSCSPEGSAPQDNAGNAISQNAIDAMQDGFLLTRPDWRVDKAFGEKAQAGGFTLATGRLMARKSDAEGRTTYGDVAPYLISKNIEVFTISATYDGFICSRLPLECLWVGASVTTEVLSHLKEGEAAAEVLSSLDARQKLEGGGRQAYLSEMKALWRHKRDIKTCNSFQQKA